MIENKRRGIYEKKIIVRQKRFEAAAWHEAECAMLSSY
jgi:hypothetical protein